jgi:putative oxidoreductase
MKYTQLLGRILFSLIFINAGFTHFTPMAAQYGAMNGVPLTGFAVPASGIIAFLGGLSIFLGFKAKIGAWLIVVFLVPVTIMMHHFWNVSDINMKMMQMANFMKNISMLGGALIIAYFGSGPCSIDTMRPKNIP